MSEPTDDPLELLVGEQTFEQLRRIVEERDDAVVSVLDREMHMLWVTRRGTRELFGRHPEEFEGDRTIDYTHPDDRDRVLAAHQRAADGERTDISYRTCAYVGGPWYRVRTIKWAVDGAGTDRPLIVAVTVRVDEEDADDDLIPPG